MLDVTPPSSVFDYRDIFDLRGRLYHQAMQKFPDARANEFLSVIREARIVSGMTVVDVPSGGAYLSRHLRDVELIGLETSQIFAELATERSKNVLLYENNRFPLKDACADRVLSIAALHHVKDKCEVFSEMRRIMCPGGRLVLADVAEDSYVRGFLDDFVGNYCETGHSGWYFGASTRSELHDAGLNIVGDKRLDYLWCAPDMDQLAEFCRLLFGMVRADTSTVADGIRDYLGIRELGDQVGLNWQLHCFTCKS
ncbi:MAG: class I SAM-dependent methyltransferase [Gammaproteobacteria bacterium]|jgi:SAM-dependent methyltransferase